MVCPYLGALGGSVIAAEAGVELRGSPRRREAGSVHLRARSPSSSAMTVFTAVATDSGWLRMTK